MDVLQQLFTTFHVTSEIFHKGQYCGSWALDTSGASYMSFHIISHGHCQLKVDDEQAIYHLEQGDIVLFPTDAGHCLTNDGEFERTRNTEVSVALSEGERLDGVGIICGYFKHNHPMMKTLTQYLPKLVLLKANQDLERSSPLMYLLRALIQESLHNAQGADLVTNKIAEAALAIIFRQHMPTENGVLAALLHPKLSKVIQAIHAAPDTKWTVDSLAALCFMSRAGFSNEFKKVMHLSPMDYVTQWRISLGYSKLLAGDANILDTALACGYDNESSFSKAFKRVMGESPGAVKKQQKKVSQTELTA